MPVIDIQTRSTTQRYAEGLIDVYAGSAAGPGGVLLTIRREPRDIYETRSIELTPEQAREIARALNEAADYSQSR